VKEDKKAFTKSLEVDWFYSIRKARNLTCKVGLSLYKKVRKMEVLSHHIYEYKKGLRYLVLHTMKITDRETAEKKLRANHIPYFIQINKRNINVFFGAEECVDVMRRLAVKPLNEFTAEEDFILGSLLGYDKRQQCQRYLSKLKLRDSHMTVVA